jgi:multidrug resistance efflux pump
MEADIAQKQAALNSSWATANQNLSEAQNDLATYKRNVENGSDTDLLNAEASVASAEVELRNAELDVESAEIEVESANINLSSARREYRDARDEYDDSDDDGDTGDSEIDSLRDQYRTASTNAEKSQTSLEKAKSNLEKAKQNLEKAQTGYEAAKVSSSDTLATYESKVKSASLNMNFSEQQLSIQEMEAELEDSTILSPVSGTVTEVYAVEGGSGNGLLFIIQDTGNLKVITNIKEYDIGTVSAGDRVIIQTDATGDKEISGTLQKIAPTSTLTSSGDEASSSTEAEYKSEIAVSSSGSREGLRVGMNAQISIITKEKKDVFSVLYDAVTKTPDRTFVYTMSQQQDGGYIAQAVDVTTGLENDLYIEISGDGLSEGMMVISDAAGVTEGMAVTPRGAASNLQGGQPASADSGAEIRMPGMGGGMGGPPQ